MDQPAPVIVLTTWPAAGDPATTPVVRRGGAQGPRVTVTVTGREATSGREPQGLV
jgi:hypothetical protein